MGVHVISEQSGNMQNGSGDKIFQEPNYRNIALVTVTLP